MGGSVMIITHQFSVVVKSIEKGLTDRKFEVILNKDDINQIKENADNVGAFILYLQDSVVGDMELVKSIVRMCDTFKDLKRNVILIGSENNKEEFFGAVPALMEYSWIDRPVDMDLLYYEIDNEIRRTNSAKEKKKILIIDDDPFYAKMISTWLSNYKVETARDGMDGISWLAKNETDLILLDYEMPIVDGAQVLEMLRTHPDTSSIPVIFLTGIGTKESISRVMKLKPQGYILKSTTNEELNRSIEEFFKKQDRG